MPISCVEIVQTFRLGVCIYCYFIMCVSLDSCHGTADRATFTCFQNNMTRNSWHTVSTVGTWRTLNQHLFETCFIIIPVCCTCVCAVFVTCPSDRMWAFEQDVAYWFAGALHPPEGSLCVCVWVNRNGRRLESVKISGSHSGDCDDCCRWVVTSCKGTAVLEARCCGTWRKVSDAGKGGKGLDYKCISGRILFLYPGDWGSRFLQHIATCLLNYTAFCTRRR